MSEDDGCMGGNVRIKELELPIGVRYCVKAGRSLSRRSKTPIL